MLENTVGKHCWKMLLENAVGKHCAGCAAELVPSQSYELLVTKRKWRSEWRSMPWSCDVL